MFETTRLIYVFFIIIDVDLQNQGHILIRNSKHLNPAQELLNEFCNPGTKITDHDHKSKLKINHRASDQRQDENVIKKQSLHFMDLLELQKRKTKLIQMIEEVYFLDFIQYTSIFLEVVINE